MRPARHLVKRGRAVVVGSIGAGKTIFSRRLLVALACPVVRRDRLPARNSTARPQWEFAASVELASADRERRRRYLLSGASWTYRSLACHQLKRRANVAVFLDFRR
jgi:hypothetical protein